MVWVESGGWEVLGGLETLERGLSGRKGMEWRGGRGGKERVGLQAGIGRRRVSWTAGGILLFRERGVIMSSIGFELSCLD